MTTQFKNDVLRKRCLVLAACCILAGFYSQNHLNAQYTGFQTQRVLAPSSQSNVVRPTVPVRPANHQVMSYESAVTLDTGMPTQSCGCGGTAGCSSCGGCGRIPVAVQMCPPQQPTGVTSGTCKPCITGIDCAQDPNGEKRWCDAQSIDFQPLWHGEYIGPVRLPSLLEYRVRINDEVTFTYIPNRQKTIEEYKLMVGDEIKYGKLFKND